jgi:hypothetical protein
MTRVAGPILGVVFFSLSRTQWIIPVENRVVDKKRDIAETKLSRSITDW